MVFPNVYHEIIDHIVIDVVESGETYIYYNSEGKFPHIEDRLFPTKEALLKKSLQGMKAIVVATGKMVEVERVDPLDNPWGWHSQMWLIDKEGNKYHEDELVIIGNYGI